MQQLLIKRRVNHVRERRDDLITDENVIKYLKEIPDEVDKSGPEQGLWIVRGDKDRVLVDACSLALGISVEIDGRIVEDAS